MTKFNQKSEKAQDAMVVQPPEMLSQEQFQELISAIQPRKELHDDAIDRLRGTFGVKKPPYKIYREIFKHKQDDLTLTNIFVCRIRALFAQLPPALPEDVQLDMTYDLLSLRIRKRLFRGCIKTFNKLSRVRVMQETFTEEIQYKVKPKLKERQVENSCRKLSKSSNNTLTNTARIEVEAERIEKSDTPKKDTFSCFGCGVPSITKKATPFAQHKIDTGDYIPVSSSPFPMPSHKKEANCKEIDEMLSSDVIESTKSDRALPLHSVRQARPFDQLKDAVISPPILQQVKKSFKIRTDSSDYALGTRLLQGDGYEEKPISMQISNMPKLVQDINEKQQDLRKKYQDESRRPSSTLKKSAWFWRRLTY
ncbi:hypothetical protein ILUMI_04469 [Ignelater luminosus]|uniref:Uncharacterized protein n=1 Tax=Ignelater luminosus TaxID=2038154 RepID=A0A8K0GL54_IGNLU|nr:hypothetical protein ILUMI_04469 [Ignelater luminosus]